MALSSFIDRRVKFRQLARHGLDPEALRGRARRARHARVADRHVGGLHQAGDARRIVGLADPAVRPRLDDRGRAAARADDRRQAHRPRFERGVGEGIVTARRNKALRGRAQGPRAVAPAEETHAPGQAGGARLPCEAGLFPIPAHHQQPEPGVGGSGQRIDRSRQAFAREAGADEEEQRVARPAAQLCSGSATQWLALTWMKVLQIHPVIDDVELLPPDAEGALHLLAHHLRVADHGAQARVLEHLFFGAADVAVIRIQGNSNPFQNRSRALSQLEPAAMHAVARAVDVAARDALVRLHYVEALSSPRRGRGARERPVAPQVSDMEGIDAQQAPRAPALAAARDQRDFGSRALERRQGAGNKPLGAPIRAVTLPHQGELQHYARSSRAAACTASTGRKLRHSLTLPPPQPSRPQGLQVCTVVTMRRSTFHGPHSFSPLGPNSATVGVPIAAARCIGIESTPTKRRARAVSAPSSLMDSVPARLIVFAFDSATILCTRSSSAVSPADVSTTWWPSEAKRSISSAFFSAGQHLKVQREAGCIWMKLSGISRETLASACFPGTKITLRSAREGWMPMRRRASRLSSTWCRRPPPTRGYRCVKLFAQNRPRPGIAGATA